jgi:hypothetical protein
LKKSTFNYLTTKGRHTFISYTLISIIIFCIPLIIFIQSIVHVRRGKRKKKKIKQPLIIFGCIMLASILVHVYLFFAYHLSMFMSFFETFVMLFAIGGITFLIFLIIAITNFAVRNKNLPKSVHNPKFVWYFPAGTAIFLAVILLWAAPTGEKLDYVHTLNEVEDMFDNADADDEVLFAFLESERDCLDCRGKTIHYNNRFFIKNNLDQVKEIQVDLTALDQYEQEIKTVSSTAVTLDPGEYAMLHTKKTSDNKSIWSRYSFRTKKPITYYRYHYYYDDPGQNNLEEDEQSDAHAPNVPDSPEYKGPNVPDLPD